MPSPNSGPSPLSRAGKVYVRLVILAGAAIFTHSLWVVTSAPVDWHWLVFAALTLLGGALTIKIPSLVALLSVSEMFAFTCVLLFGPAAGMLTLAIDGAILSLRRNHRVERMLFNAAELGISIWAGSHLFFQLAGVAPLYHHPMPVGAIILPMAAMTTAYFLLNSGLTATAIGLESGAPPQAVWRRHFAWLVPNYFAGASMSLLLVTSLREEGFSAIALILPLLLLSYLTLRTSLGRVEDADRHVAQVNRLYLSTVESLATAIDAKDEVTHGHIRRVQRAAVGLARALGVRDEGTIEALQAAALLHDTGKLAIPEHILNKPGKLTADEFEVIKQHARIGAEILSPVDFPFPVVPIVRHHHESWDGTGYPDGIAGTDIPIGARILSVVDCFDALTSDRPYRRRMTEEAATAILRERSGKMYDPLVVDTFLALRRDIMPPQEESTGSPAAAVRSRLAAVGHPQAPVPAPPPTLAASTSMMAPPKHAEDLLAFSSLSRALSSEGSLSDTLALVWTHLRRLVPASMAGFYSVDAIGSVVLRHACGVGPPGLPGLTITAGHGVSGWVASNRRVMMNAEAVLDLDELAMGSTPALQSCLSVPLLTGETLIGVVTLYSDRPAAFTDEDSRLIQTVAPHIAESFQIALSRSTTAPAPAADGETGLKARPCRTEAHADAPRLGLRVVSNS